MHPASYRSFVRIGLIALLVPLAMGTKCVPRMEKDGGAGGAGGSKATDGGVTVTDAGGKRADGASDSGASAGSGGNGGARTDGGAGGGGGTGRDGSTADGPSSVGACAASPTTVWTATAGPAFVVNLWAIGPGDVLASGIQLSRWNGSSWNAFSPQPPFNGDVTASSDNDIWIQQFGSTSKFPVAHWDGTDWTDVSLTFPSGTTWAPLLLAGPDDAWVSVQVPVSLTPDNVQNVQGAVYHWTGSAWTKVASPVDSALNISIRLYWSSSPSDIWAITFGGFVHWDGSSWTPVVSPLTSNDIVEAIWGSSSRDIWAVGENGTNARMWHFDGAAWTTLEFSNRGVFTAVWGSCAGDFWATLLSQDVGATPLWHYDGSVWSPLPISGAAQPGDIITGTSPDDVWMTATTANTLLHRQPGRCGDGTIGPGEQCDPPQQGTDGLQCDSTCHLLTCGNGVIDPGEACDPPKSTGSTNLCDQSCQIPGCGNGIIDPGESCDPPNTNVCDSQCQSIPIVCGNGIIQPGETCDFTNGPFCTNCQITTCGGCFFSSLGPMNVNPTRADFVCQALSGTARTNCQALLNCMSNDLSQCVVVQIAAFQTACYCSDATCSAGVNGQCVAQFNAVAGTTDPTVIIGELNDSTSLLSQVRAEAEKFGTSACGSQCTGGGLMP